MNYGSLSIGFVPVRRYAINRLCSISALDTLNQRRPTILQSSFENRSTTLDHKTLGKPFKRYQSTAQIYRWNDVLFGSTFNEIVRFETANFDLNQYSVNNKQLTLPYLLLIDIFSQISSLRKRILSKHSIKASLV